MSNKPCFFLSIIFTLSWASFAEEEPKNQTIIEDKLEQDNTAKFIYVKDRQDEQTPADAAVLFHIPGLTVTDKGGAMGDAQFTYRGLSNSRYLANLNGLSLNNPMTGILDANSMFLFAAKYLQANTQSLDINLPTITSPEVKAIIGYGSQHSFKLGGSAGLPIGKSTIFMATQLTSSNGKFYFSSPDNPSGPDILRLNNDQHRLQTVVKFEKKSDLINSHALLALSFHEGGIPGYARSPTKDLRNFTSYGGLALGLSSKIKDYEFKLNAANSLFSYFSKDPEREEKFLSSTHELSFTMKSFKLPKGIEFEMGPQIVVERAYELDKTRIGGGLWMKRSMAWRGRLKPRTDVTFSMIGYHTHGLVFKKDFALSIDPTHFMTVTGRFVRQQRLPTFMELYANNSFFKGNPGLEKESIMDFEIGTNIRLGAHTNINVNAFMGFLGDTIVNVPYKFNQTRPTNVKTARRYGLDTAISFEPLNWLLIESKNSLLGTKIKEFDAPMPNAPLFSGLTKVRFGFEDFLALNLQVRYRTSATANLYGSIYTKGYALCDSVLSARVLDRLGLSLSVTNIFNVKTARDTYEIPLSGTVFFAQIDVGNI